VPLHHPSTPRTIKMSPYCHTQVQ